jgi:hypothetical protein
VDNTLYLCAWVNFGYHTQPERSASNQGFYNRFHQPDWARSSLPRGLRPLLVRASRGSWPATVC